MVHVAFALETSKVLHGGEPTYPGEPVVVQLVPLLWVRDGIARVVDENGPGDVHVSRLYNVFADSASDGQDELDSWGDAP